MKVSYGIVQNIESVKAIVGQLPKLRSQASATALVSLFSESGGMSCCNFSKYKWFTRLFSVMEYRKNLKGPDPYPEDYFDKK
ncbi:hypothetical protein F2A31_10295 [Acinetobacter suaedae]|uniref:Uncharacterized protein n=1 Tax=Acinetobacter suaedae TaxID=2609668 RepID=A0A5P1UTM8_9GAMM|nr:hypothetical protein F2A31_10295 [Acinetobacter sp. C16S1]